MGKRRVLSAQDSARGCGRRSGTGGKSAVIRGRREVVGGNGAAARDVVGVPDDSPRCCASAAHFALQTPPDARPRSADCCCAIGSRLGDLRTGDLAAPQIATSAEPAPPAAPEIATLFSATDRLYRTTDKMFLIVECRKCRLIRLYPQPSPLRTARLLSARLLVRPRDLARPTGWSSGTAASCCAIICISSSAPCENPRKQGIGARCRLRRRTVSPNAAPRRRKERWSGLDFSLDAANVAWRRAGVPAVCATLSRAPFAPASCAAVTMFHVLEHLYDPASYLDAAHRAAARPTAA